MSKTRLEQMAEEYAKGVCGNISLREPPLYRAVAARDGYIAGFEAARETAAATTFEHVRCDDRTDRWLVANIVAEHVRSLGTEPAEGDAT